MDTAPSLPRHACCALSTWLCRVLVRAQPTPKEPTVNAFLRALAVQRWDDHRYYHHSRINQTLHLISACSFVVGYVLLFYAPAMAALVCWLVGKIGRAHV